VNVLVDGIVQLSEPTEFRTFPAEGKGSHLKLVMLTDFGSTIGSQPPLKKQSPAFKNAAAEEPDLVFLGGDLDHRDPVTLQAKRQMFKDVYGLNNPNAKMDAFVTEILRKFPLAHHWDDHDYSTNDSNRFAVDRSIAQQVFREYFPAYPFPSDKEIYQRFQFGNVDFFILDNRSQRDPNQLANSPTKSMLDGEHLGASGQLRWLLRGLKTSDARWKVIFSSSVFNPTTGKADTWRSFRYEHDRIVNFIDKHEIQNVLILSGDIHAGALDDGTHAGVPEMVVPAANLAYCFTVPQCCTGSWTHGIYGDPTRTSDVPCNGYGVLKVTDQRAKLIVKDQDGHLRLRMRIVHRD
jgi:alkaline phosphatase D